MMHCSIVVRIDNPNRIDTSKQSQTFCSQALATTVGQTVTVIKVRRLVVIPGLISDYPVSMSVWFVNVFLTRFKSLKTSTAFPF